MDTWNDSEDGERKQLNQFHDLQMFGEHMARPLEDNAVILRSHWQYHVKRDGQRRARQCCDGSKRAAPILHALAKTYSSCVEHPIQRQFLALHHEQIELYQSLDLNCFSTVHKPNINHTRTVRTVI